MRNILTVLKHEVSITLRKRSFWIFSFIVPVLMLGFQGYYILIDSGVDIGIGGDEDAEESSAAFEPTLVGLVDDSGIIIEIPQGVPPDIFHVYSDLDEGRAALSGGQIDQVVHIPADYIASGEVRLPAERRCPVAGRDWYCRADTGKSARSFQFGPVFPNDSAGCPEFFPEARFHLQYPVW